MSDRLPYRKAPWPPDVPKPGHPAWPDGAVNGISGTFPGQRWLQNVLDDQPWMLTIATATQLRVDIQALRDQYQATARTWSRMLPPKTTQKLLEATAAEGQRLTRLLEQVLALEEALSPAKSAHQPEPATVRDVSTGGVAAPGLSPLRAPGRT
jgi:hypothetical protein